jgi:hypothetical protein
VADSREARTAEEAALEASWVDVFWTAAVVVEEMLDVLAVVEVLVEVVL